MTPDPGPTPSAAPLIDAIYRLTHLSDTGKAGNLVYAIRKSPRIKHDDLWFSEGGLGGRPNLASQYRFTGFDEVWPPGETECRDIEFTSENFTRTPIGLRFFVSFVGGEMDDGGEFTVLLECSNVLFFRRLGERPMPLRIDFCLGESVRFDADGDYNYTDPDSIIEVPPSRGEVFTPEGEFTEEFRLLVHRPV